MEDFEKRKILKLIESNQGTSIENIIEYLDYINKVRYSQEELRLFLDDLTQENKIYVKDALWYKS